MMKAEMYINTRLDNNDPTFVCSPGAYLDYNKVGLITADEVVYSGALRQNQISSGSYSYLKDGWRTLTLTPRTSNTAIAYFYSVTNKELGRLNSTTLSVSYSIRFVINLSPDVVVSGGDGLSAETAYVIQ